MRILVCPPFALLFLVVPLTLAAEPTYFPPSEDRGGWRTLLPATGDPGSSDKANIQRLTGVDWDKLAAAWRHNAAAEGATGLVVIRHGHIVGEWYKDCDRAKTFNIFSSSKVYTSTAFGVLLGDMEAGKSVTGKQLTLDTKVCTADWLPESLALTDPRKADITLRHLLTMLSGIGGGGPPAEAPFEWALGQLPGSPVIAKLTGTPGTVFNYSDANICHLVLLFQRAAGRDLLPFLKERVFEPIGLRQATWLQIGGKGHLGPLSQGFSGLHTTAREHARFCYLALHRGNWAGKRIVLARHYDFAWKGTTVKPDYGALWWVYPHLREAPKDLVESIGYKNNLGIIVPSLDLVVVRLGDGAKYPPNFERELVKKILAAVSN